MKACPHCKRPFAPEIVLGGKRRQALYDYVARHPEGVGVDDIMSHIYADDVNGGAESRNIVAVMTRQINKKLEARGYPVRLRGSGGPGSRYRIIPSNGEA